MKKFMTYGYQGEIWTRKWNKREKQKKVKVFLQEKLGLATEEFTVERAHRIRKKEEGKNRTIIAKLLNYKHFEKVLHKYKELKLWDDQIYTNGGFGRYTVERRKILFKGAKEIR